MNTLSGGLLTRADAKESEIRAVVTRCGCGNPSSHAGQVCPRPRRIEDLGRISYWHRNPLRRLWWNLTHNR